jgi:hypothetical protein
VAVIDFRYGVIYTIATVGHVLPAFAGERTFSKSVGMAKVLPTADFAPVVVASS